MSAHTVHDTIAARTDQNKGSLVAYLPAGYPTLLDSIEAAVAALEGGADVLELGVPYSDPVMDGPVIAEATQAALDAGFKLTQLFPAVKEITTRTNKPVLVMTYWNPVVQYGVEKFAHDLAEAGGAGLITPDLIPDEAAEWLRVSDKYNLERVFLSAPSSTNTRLNRAIEVSKGFVYAVSTMGITGAREDVDQAARVLVTRLREQGVANICVGLGISTPEQVRDVVSFADGAIVGSALVKALSAGGASAVRDLAQALAQGTTRA
jgi:tryptophan synthase alpha chain